MGGDVCQRAKRGKLISNGLGSTAFDPKGNTILNIPTGGGATNNVFADQDEKTLFITGRWTG